LPEPTVPNPKPLGLSVAITTNGPFKSVSPTFRGSVTLSGTKTQLSDWEIEFRYSTVVGSAITLFRQVCWPPVPHGK
jgi:hypothetical protein